MVYHLMVAGIFLCCGFQALGQSAHPGNIVHVCYYEYLPIEYHINQWGLQQNLMGILHVDLGLLVLSV